MKHVNLKSKFKHKWLIEINDYFYYQSRISLYLYYVKTSY